MKELEERRRRRRRGRGGGGGGEKEVEEQEEEIEKEVEEQEEEIEKEKGKYSDGRKYKLYFFLLTEGHSYLCNLAPNTLSSNFTCNPTPPTALCVCVCFHLNHCFPLRVPVSITYVRTSRHKKHN